MRGWACGVECVCGFCGVGMDERFLNRHCAMKHFWRLGRVVSWQNNGRSCDVV